MVTFLVYSCLADGTNTTGKSELAQPGAPTTLNHQIQELQLKVRAESAKPDLMKEEFAKALQLFLRTQKRESMKPGDYWLPGEFESLRKHRLPAKSPSTGALTPRRANWSIGDGSFLTRSQPRSWKATHRTGEDKNESRKNAS
jgi:hypothetical protein